MATSTIGIGTSILASILAQVSPARAQANDPFNEGDNSQNRSVAADLQFRKLRLALFDGNGSSLDLRRFEGVVVDTNGIQHTGHKVGPNLYDFSCPPVGPYWVSVAVPGFQREALVIDKLDDEGLELPLTLKRSSETGAGLDVAPPTLFRIRRSIVDASSGRAIGGVHVRVASGKEVLVDRTVPSTMDITVRSSSSLSVYLQAEGYAPTAFTVDETERDDIREVKLLKGIMIVVAVTFPRDISIGMPAFQYMVLDPTRSTTPWNARIDKEGPVTLCAPSDGVAVRAWGWNGSDRWCSPWTVLSPPTDASISLPRPSTLVIEPCALNKRVQIDVFDALGYLVYSDDDYGDIPRRMSLPPGKYELHFPNKEYEALGITITDELLRIALHK